MSDDFDPTRLPPAPVTPIRERPISRSQAKWIENRTRGAVDGMIGATERQRRNADEAIREREAKNLELQRKCLDYEFINLRLRMVLEACARRLGGRVVFDREEILKQCARGRVVVDEESDRITLALLPELEIATSDTEC